MTGAATNRLIDLSTNDYLGLRAHPRVCEAAIEAIRSHGLGSGGARAVAAGLDLLERLECDLASFRGVEASLVCASGTSANMSVLADIARRGDLVVADEHCHPSVIDGLRLSRAATALFPHRDVAALDRMLRVARSRPSLAGRSRKIVVVTDGVFGIGGDIAPLREICDVAERHAALVMVDDAHGTGVLGRNGRGIVDHCGLLGRVDIQTGTFSKALGALGGFVAGSRGLCSALLEQSRLLASTTSLPPAVAAACLAALEILEREPQRLERLWSNTRLVREGLQDLDFDIGASETPIIPVMVGESSLATRLSLRLLELGVLVKPLTHPFVRRHEARLRVSVTSEHTPYQLERCLDAFGRLRDGSPAQSRRLRR